MGWTAASDWRINAKIIFDRCCASEVLLQQSLDFRRLLTWLCHYWPTAIQSNPQAIRKQITPQASSRERQCGKGTLCVESTTLEPRQRSQNSSGSLPSQNGHGAVAYPLALAHSASNCWRVLMFCSKWRAESSLSPHASRPPFHGPPRLPT